MGIIFLIIGLVIGAFLGYFFNKSISKSKTEFDKLYAEFNEANSAKLLIEDRYKSINSQNQLLMEQFNVKDSELKKMQIGFASLETNFNNVQDNLTKLLSDIKMHEEANKRLQEEVNKEKQKNSEINAINTTNLNSLSFNKQKLDVQENKLNELNDKLIELNSQNSSLVANNKMLLDKLEKQKEEIEGLHQTSQLQFEKVANQLLEEKSKRFTENNKANIEALLNPLKEDINNFKSKVEDVYHKESKERFSLGEKVKELIEQTNKVSEEANNLATALKGQTKKQGNWGEMILERILETSGLTKNREYFVQETIKGEDGKNLRPDILVKLPDDRVIIIDSKVSLVSFDRFNSAENSDEQPTHLADHIKSMYAHIDDLNSKNYDNLENSLDFTMMFIPIEPAYLISIQSDQQLWSYAYSKRILLISPTNLIACLKLISDLWNREKQSKNAMEIVRRGELLYDKFVTFTSSIEDIGKYLDKTQVAYNSAIDQLKNGRGNLIGQAIHLKSLGLKSNKVISNSMLPVDFEELNPDESVQSNPVDNNPKTQ